MAPNATMALNVELGVEPDKESLSWRNADNQNVRFATSAEMKAWLLGLVVAVSQRNSAVYAWSWAEKEAARSALTPSIPATQ